MAEKIELFLSLRKYFQILGSYSPESEKKRSFNPRNIFTLFCYIQLFLSVLAFTFFRAETIIEYGLNYYGYVTEALHTFVILSQIFGMAGILELIENCEGFIDNSK